MDRRRKPNLLFIFTDEQRADTMEAYGNARIEMPNLNRFCRQSYVFDRAYVTQPVCTPSRSTLLTGLYPHTNGCTENNVPLRADTPCFPELLSGAGYSCGYHGKWHLGDEIFAQHGFGEWRGIDDGYARYYSEERDPAARSAYHHWLVGKGLGPANGDRFSRGQVAGLPEELSKPAFLAGEAIRFLNEKRNDSFVLFVNFFEPHMPFTGPRDRQYDPCRVPLPANYEYVPGSEQPLKTRLFRKAYQESGVDGIPYSNEAAWRRTIANYWGLCSLVDTHAGRIMAEVDRLGLRDNTIVVYTSDHGDMMGSHGLLAKCVMYEEAARVPMVVRMPGQKLGRRIRGPVSQIDLVPTLLDAMGVPVPSHLQGMSLVGSLKEPGDCGCRNDVFMEWNGPNNGFGDAVGQVRVPECMLEVASRHEVVAATTDPVRTVVTVDGWKYNHSTRDEHELYNINEDPLETRNLARDSHYRSVMADLRGRIRGWQERTGDTAPLCTEKA